MRSGKTSSRFKALVKTIARQFYVAAFVGMFGLFEWAIGYEIIPLRFVALTFLISVVIVSAFWVRKGAISLQLIGKSSISPDNHGKFIHRRLIGTRWFSYGGGTFALLLYLVARIDHLQNQGQFMYMEFSPRSASEFLILALGLFLFVEAFLARIEYDDDTIIWRSALLFKKSRRWADLIEIKKGTDRNRIFLRFSGSDTVRISVFYEARDQIINFAKSKLNNA